jgi:hypothetical protein
MRSSAVRPPVGTVVPGGTPALLSSHAGAIAFESDTSALLSVQGVAAPFRFQNGLYRVAVP